MGTPSVGTIVVTHDRRDVLERTLAAVLAQTWPPVNVCVVDNASSDGTEAMVRSRFPDVEYLLLADNLGPAGGFATGLRHYADRPFEHLWFLDDDSRPLPTALERILEVARNLPHCGAVGLDGGSLRWGIPSHGSHRGRFPEVCAEAGLHRCDFVLWDGAVVATQAVSEVGHPREELFIMMEDIEYTNRIARAGWDVIRLDETLIHRAHLGSGGAEGGPPAPWRGYYQTRNHLLVARGHRSAPELAGWGWRLSKQLVATVFLLDRKGDRLRLRLLGAWHGVRGIAGRQVEPTA